MNKEQRLAISKLITGICCDTKTNLGICDNIRRFTDYGDSLFFRNMLRKVAKTWPKYSGDWVYPVPSLSEAINPWDMFYQNTGKLWDPWTEYGRNRLELAELYVRYLLFYKCFWTVRFCYWFGIIYMPKVPFTGPRILLFDKWWGDGG